MLVKRFERTYGDQPEKIQGISRSSKLKRTDPLWLPINVPG